MFSSKGHFSRLLSIFLTIVDASAVARRGGKSTLAISREFTRHHESLSLVGRDRARGTGLENQSQVGELDVTFTGEYYVAQVGVGDPAKNYTLILDNASAHTWVGARVNNGYTPTTTSVDTGHNYTVPYFEGTWHGEEWTDTVTLGPDLAISQQAIGVSHTLSSNNDIDGYLGVGPSDLSENHVDGMDTVPTVMDTLYIQGKISEQVLGVFLRPGSRVGKLTFGGYDESVINGDMHYFPVTTAPRGSDYWGVDLSISYGNDKIMSSAAGILATSLPFVSLAPDVYYNYKAKTGATIDPATGYLTITPDQYDNLEPLTFIIGGVSFTLMPNAQLWPRQLNGDPRSSSDKIYLAIADLGDMAQSGFEFILGYTFLERFYSVFDTTNQRIGLAYTDYSFAEVN